MNPPTTSQDALTQLQNYQSGLQGSGDIINSAQAKLGVPGAQQQVSGLRSAITNTTNLLNNVAPGVMGRTGNSIVTSAQANRMIQNEQAPIAQQFTGYNQDLGNAQSDYSNLLGQANTQAQAQISDQNQHLTQLQGLYDALYGREQDTAKMAEAKREFDISQANALAKSNSGGINFGLGGLGGAATTAPTPNVPAASIIQNGSSFNFKDSQGKPITAAQYSQLTGVGYRDLLAKMAGEGDKNAQAALGYVGNDAKFGNAPDALRGALGALGATGNFFAPSYAPGVYAPAPVTNGTAAINRGASSLLRGL